MLRLSLEALASGNFQGFASNMAVVDGANVKALRRYACPMVLFATLRYIGMKHQASEKSSSKSNAT